MLYRGKAKLSNKAVIFNKQKSKITSKYWPLSQIMIQSLKSNKNSVNTTFIWGCFKVEQCDVGKIPGSILMSAFQMWSPHLLLSKSTPAFETIFFKLHIMVPQKQWHAQHAVKTYIMYTFLWYIFICHYLPKVACSSQDNNIQWYCQE